MKKIFVLLFHSFLGLAAVAQVNEAIMLKDAGTLDKAKTAIDKAIDNPKQNIKAKTWYTRGSIYRAIGDDRTGLFSKLDSNAYLKAYEAYEKAISLEPESKDAKKAAEDIKTIYMQVGAVKFQKQDFAGAGEMFEKALAAKPKDTIAAFYGGVAALRANNYPKAAELFEKSIEIGYKTEEPYQSLAQIYSYGATKNFDKAQTIITKGLAKFPDNEELKKSQLNLYLGSPDKKEEAIKSLEEGLKKNPNNALYASILGTLYDQKGEKDKAQTYYEKSLQLDANNYDVNYNLGVLWFNKAAELNSQVIEDEKKLKLGQESPKKPEVDRLFKTSLPYFEKAHQLKPDEMETLVNLSKVYKLLKMKDKEMMINKKIEGN